MTPTVDGLARRTIADIYDLRRAHSAEGPDGLSAIDVSAAADGADAGRAAATLAAAAAAVRRAVGELSAAGLPSAEVHLWVATIAHLADHLLLPLHQAQGQTSGGQTWALGAAQALWATQSVAATVLGSDAAAEHFSTQIAKARGDASFGMQQTWALALALGCRGPTSVTEAAGLCASLVPATPLQQLPDGLMGGGRRGATSRRRGRALGQWGWALAAPCSLLVGYALMRGQEAALFATLARISP